MHQQVRRGDVLLQPIDKVPSTAKRQKVKGLVILAYGETSGHAHGMYGRVAMFRDDGLGRKLTTGGKPCPVSEPFLEGADLVVAKDGTQLGHGTPNDALTLPSDPDHGAIPVTGGFAAIRQREFPRGELARTVAD